jgi:hypothetical protein
MLLIELPKEDRREFMEAVLRLADEIDEKSEAAEKKRKGGVLSYSSTKQENSYQYLRL